MLAHKRRNTHTHKTTDDADDFTEDFITHIFAKHGLPSDIVSDWSPYSHQNSRLHSAKVEKSLEIMAYQAFLDVIQSGYAKETWYQTLPSAELGLSSLALHNGFW